MRGSSSWFWLWRTQWRSTPGRPNPTTSSWPSRWDVPPAQWAAGGVALILVPKFKPALRDVIYLFLTQNHWKLFAQLLINIDHLCSGKYLVMREREGKKVLWLVFQSFGDLVHKPLLVDLTVEEGQRLKVIYGSCSGFHAVDVDSGAVYDIYLPTHVRIHPHDVSRGDRSSCMIS